MYPTFLYIVSLLLFFCQPALAQQSKFTDKYLDYIFSGNYPQAAKIMLSEEKKNPNSLDVKLAAAHYYSVMYEISGNKQKDFSACKKYANALVRLSEEKKMTDSETVFQVISAKALHLKILMHKKEYLQAAKTMQAVIADFKYALKHDQNEKMKLIAGTYRYYIEIAKEDYPLLYPILLLYPSGNKAKGLKQLNECVHSKDKYVQTKALLQLATIYYRDEKNIEKAIVYFEALSRKYPNNLLWQTEYAKALKKYHLTKQYNMRRQIIKALITKSTFLTNTQRNYFKTENEL